MRKGYILLACALSALTAPAQDKWQGSVEFEPTFWTYKGATPSLGLNFTATRSVNEIMSLGFGLGIAESAKFQGNPTMPVFIRAHVEQSSAERKLSPFVNLDLGYSMNFDNFDYGAVIINPTVGVRYGHVSLGVGYMGSIGTWSGAKMSSGINLRLAYHFGYHKPDPNSPLRRFCRKLEFSFDLGTDIPFISPVKNETEWARQQLWYYDDPLEPAEFRATARQFFMPGPSASASLLYPVWKNLYLGLNLSFNSIASRKLPIDKIYKDGKELPVSEYGEERLYGYGFHSNGNKIEKEAATDFFYNLTLNARIKYKIKELTFGKGFYPFAQIDLGGTVYNSNDYRHRKGFNFAPAIGLSKDVRGGKSSIDLTIGLSTLRCTKYIATDHWEVQARNYQHYEIMPSLDEVGYKNTNTLRIAIGYTF